MYSQRQNIVRSPTGSRRDSYDSVSKSGTNGRPYQAQSSIAEETTKDDNDYVDPTDDQENTTRTEPTPPRPREDQYIEALRHRFPSRPKTDYAYTKPPGPLAPTPAPAPPPPNPPSTSQTTPASTGPYSTTRRPNTSGGTSTPDTYEGRTLPKPVLRRVTEDQQNNYARSIAADLEAKERARTGLPTAPSTAQQPRTTNPGLNVRITEPNKPFNQSDLPTNAQLSIFEKIPSHGGPVHYLGTATFSQFEHCLHECLERERRQTGVASQIIRQDIPGSISPLDYADGHVSASSYYGLDPTRVHAFDDYPSQPTSTYAMDDLRYINAALSRRGISLFPDQQIYPYCSSSRLSPIPYASHYRSGDIVSACQIANEDPSFLYSKNGSLAVQNVWNALRNCR